MDFYANVVIGNATELKNCLFDCHSLGLDGKSMTQVCCPLFPKTRNPQKLESL